MSCCNQYSSSKILPVPHPPISAPHPITKCCLNCKIQIGEVETLNPDMPAYANMEQGQCSGYTLDLGIPQGQYGPVGPVGPAGSCECSIQPDGKGCFLMTATDGNVVRCCLVRSGSSSNYKWECRLANLDEEDSAQ